MNLNMFQNNWLFTNLGLFVMVISEVENQAISMADSDYEGQVYSMSNDQKTCSTRSE